MYGVPPNPLVSFYIASIPSVYELVLPCKMCQIGINQIINKKLRIHTIEIHRIFTRLNTEKNKMKGTGTPAKAKKEKNKLGLSCRGAKSAGSWDPRCQKVFEESGSGRKFWTISTHFSGR